MTHSLQQPNQTAGVTGGMPQLIETVAKTGIAVGVDSLFMETHEDPSVAKSDGANMLKLDLLEGLLTKLVRSAKCYKMLFVGDSQVRWVNLFGLWATCMNSIKIRSVLQ